MENKRNSMLLHQVSLTILGVFLSTSVGSSVLRAQATAQINGTVRDATGLAVPGAQVKATQEATGAVRTAPTGADGGYVLPNLPIGPYRLEVTREEFTTFEQSGIVLQVASNPTIDMTLKVGAVSERVQVEAWKAHDPRLGREVAIQVTTD